MKKRIFIILMGLMLMAQIAYAESMKVNVTSNIAGNYGVMSMDTNYSSTLNNGFLRQNRYEFEAHEVGGECMINHTVGVASSSDIETTLEMQMFGVPQPGISVFLDTEEKIGVGILRTRAENQVEKFTGAIGSGIDVVEVSHTSESYINNGNVGHTVLSDGQGLVIAGAVGHYYLYQGPVPGEGEGIHPQICPWDHGVELKELANQSYEHYYRYQGDEYSYEFTGVIGPPTPFETE